jgi:hypothetical protein
VARPPRSPGRHRCVWPSSPIRPSPRRPPTPRAPSGPWPCGGGGARPRCCHRRASTSASGLRRPRPRSRASGRLHAPGGRPPRPRR